jgi:hypothetical protein
MVMSKSAEMFAEAIPGFIVQVVALISSEKKSTAAAISLLMSAFSVAYATASSAYDKDTSPSERRREPTSFGMIPDTGRGVAFAIMFSLSALQVIAKGTSFALLFVADRGLLVKFLCTENAVSHCWFLLRRDWLVATAVPRSVVPVLSLVVRTVGGPIFSTNGYLIVRIADNATGFWFTLYFLSWGVFCSFLAAHLYDEYAAEGLTKLAPEATFGFAATVSTLWTITFVYFLFFVCVPEYRASFWSLQTGREYVESYFLDNEGDEELRFRIFNYNERKWANISDDVEAWSHANWARWVAEEPSWFTPLAISKVSNRFIPKAELAALGYDKTKRGSAQ